MTTNYTGSSISFEEMPQGCIISGVPGSYTPDNFYVVVSTSEDARALVESLNRLIQFRAQEGLE